MTDGAAPKKGLSTGAKIAIGCGAVIVLGAIAMMLLLGWGVSKAKEYAEEFEENPAKAVAETAVRVNPELDLVSTDDEAGTITFRNDRTGEEATITLRTSPRASGA